MNDILTNWRKPPKAAAKALLTTEKLLEGKTFTQPQKEELIEQVYLLWNVDGIVLEDNIIYDLNKGGYGYSHILALVSRSKKDGSGYMQKIINSLKQLKTVEWKDITL